ncbi:unnamed protein product [Enterobius vermicularis]|uniref:Apoptogenic protein 1, mitochondrial n=1 Tax=Enterobius vermicularis TaxID=51028 RepID=A0A0N4VKN2_ENTVE|nr:unnamed protein product [Enterobius vermicularis]
MKFPPVKQTRLDRRYDWVGPPDKVSRIRPIRLRRLHDETSTERKFREFWENMNEWNHRFWETHNLLYEKRKAEFIAHKKSNSLLHEKPTANELSDFYKSFLNENYESLAAYNREWYSRNFKLLWLAAQVSVVRFRRMFFKWF